MRIYAAIVSMIAASTLFNYLWHGAYYQLMAIGIFLLFWELKAKVKNVAAMIGFWLSLSNLADEFFFDPKVIQANEYVFAVLIIFLTYKRHASDTGR